jgi:hypothetical protein
VFPVRHEPRKPPTSGGRSAGIVHSRTQATEFLFLSFLYNTLSLHTQTFDLVKPTQIGTWINKNSFFVGSFAEIMA